MKVKNLIDSLEAAAESEHPSIFLRQVDLLAIAKKLRAADELAQATEAQIKNHHRPFFGVGDLAARLIDYRNAELEKDK